MAHSTENQSINHPRIAQSRPIAAAVGIHLGLGFLCVSAVCSSFQQAIFTLPRWGAVLVVAAALIYAGLRRAPRAATATWSRLLLALGGIMVFRLGYAPALESIGRLGEILPAEFLETYPGIGLVGVIIAAISWGIWVSAGGQRNLGVIPFRRSILIGGGLAFGSVLLAFLLLRGPHELFLSESLGPALKIIQATLIAAVLVSVPGGPGISRAPYFYIGLALIAAFVRNMAFPVQY